MILGIIFGSFFDLNISSAIASGCLVLLVAFDRVLAAAHILSDVSWGATMVISLLFIANEVVALIKPLQLKETPQE